jgi:hypothetical protein
MLPALHCIYISATGWGMKVADGQRLSPPAVFSSFIFLRGKQDTVDLTR